MAPNFLDTFGISLILLYLIVLIVVVRIMSSLKFAEDKYTGNLLFYAFLFKIFMGLGYGFIFDFYYNWGGDTYVYFENACNLGDQLFRYPVDFFRILFDQINQDNYHTLQTNDQYYMNFRAIASYNTHRYLSLFTIAGFKNYYLTTICLNSFLFIILWKFYRFVSGLFPEKKKMIAVGILFIPSATFWSSGLIKDSFTLTFSMLFVISFYKIFFLRKFSLKYILLLLFSIYIITSLKPYIFYALFISGMIWLGFSYVHLVKSRFLRIFILPPVMVIVGFVGIYAFTAIAGRVGGAYKDVDSMLSKAVGSQQDLKQEYYEGNSFNIGDYEPTLVGTVSVTPAAIMAGLYRPYLWEARNPVMLLSGLENLFLLLVTIYVLFRAGPIFFFKELAKEPFIIFCFMFSIVMAWGIGLSTSNFGALVRFKIPLLPFFLMGWLFVLDIFNKKLKEEKLAKRSVAK